MISSSQKKKKFDLKLSKIRGNQYESSPAARGKFKCANHVMPPLPKSMLLEDKERDKGQQCKEERIATSSQWKPLPLPSSNYTHLTRKRIYLTSDSYKPPPSSSSSSNESSSKDVVNYDELLQDLDLSTFNDFD